MKMRWGLWSQSICLFLEDRTKIYIVPVFVSHLNHYPGSEKSLCFVLFQFTFPNWCHWGKCFNLIYSNPTADTAVPYEYSLPQWRSYVGGKHSVLQEPELLCYAVPSFQSCSQFRVQSHKWLWRWSEVLYTGAHISEKLNNPPPWRNMTALNSVEDINRCFLKVRENLFTCLGVSLYCPDGLMPDVLKVYLDLQQWFFWL